MNYTVIYTNRVQHTMRSEKIPVKFRPQTLDLSQTHILYPIHHQFLLASS